MCRKGVGLIDLKDLAHIKARLAEFQNKGGDVDVNVIDKSLVALQGTRWV